MGTNVQGPEIQTPTPDQQLPLTQEKALNDKLTNTPYTPPTHTINNFSGCEHVTLHMMKFPKPRILEQNNYPDLILSDPILYKNIIHKTVFPDKNSDMDQYYNNTIAYLKNTHRLKNTKIPTYTAITNQDLYFIQMTI